MKTYPEADQILERVKGAGKVLLALHAGPDPDSVGSNLALYLALKQLGKEDVELISVDEVPGNLLFLPCVATVRQENIAEKDISSFDLFVALDSSDSGMLTPDHTLPAFPDVMTVMVIDHHFTNTRYGQINIVDDSISSTGELLFNLFGQWQIEISKDVATCLLTAIASDTGTFRWSTTADTLQVASQLARFGASLKEISFNLYQRVPLKSFHYVAKVFEKLQIEKAGRYNFVWAALSFPEIKELGEEVGISSANFLQGIDGTDFGVLLTEEEENLMKGSLRSRTGFDVSKMAVALGGGGHKAAAGFTIKAEFDEAVKRVLETVKRIAEKNE